MRKRDSMMDHVVTGGVERYAGGEESTGGEESAGGE